MPELQPLKAQFHQAELLVQTLEHIPLHIALLTILVILEQQQELLMLLIQQLLYLLHQQVLVPMKIKLRLEQLPQLIFNQLLLVFRVLNYLLHLGEYYLL